MENNEKWGEGTKDGNDEIPIGALENAKIDINKSVY